MFIAIRPHRVGVWALVALWSVNVASAQETRTVEAAQLAAVLQEDTHVPANAHHAQGEVTVVEYFDYNCPVCRALEPDLRKLLAADKKVRLIRKDWTIFGDGSVYAAYASFAAAGQHKYPAAHAALMASSKDLDTREDVLSVLKQVGFDAAKIDSDVTAHEQEYAAQLARVRREAEALGLHGTPGLIVGHQLVVGGRTDYARLQRLVAAARAHP